MFLYCGEFTLGAGAARGWLSLSERLADRASAMQGATPLSKAEESLKSLNTEVPSGLIIDTLLTSPIQIFRNLVHLSIVVSCRDESDGGSAISSCNDHFTDLATTLPRLESLLLGRACF